MIVQWILNLERKGETPFMAMIDEDVRTFVYTTLGTLWGEPGKVVEGFSPQRADVPRIWYRRTSSNNDLLLGAKSEITTTDFDIEIISDDIVDAQEIAQALKDALNGYSGSFGNSTALLAEVADHDDTYEPQGLGDGDEGLHVSTLMATIIHR